MFCPVCHDLLLDQSARCPNCGAQLPPANAAARALRYLSAYFVAGVPWSGAGIGRAKTRRPRGRRPAPDGRPRRRPARPLAPIALLLLVLVCASVACSQELSDWIQSVPLLAADDGG